MQKILLNKKHSIHKILIALIFIITLSNMPKKIKVHGLLLIEEWLKQDTLNIQTKYLKDSDLSYFYFGKEQKRCHIVLNDSLGLVHSKWVDNYFDDSQDFPDTIFIQDKIFPLSELFEQKLHINWLKDEEIDCIKFYQLNYKSRKYLFFVGRGTEIWNHSPDKYWILIDITDKFSPQIYPVINSTMQPYFIGDRDANGVVEYLDWHLPNYQDLDTFYFYQINHIPEKMPFYLCGAPTEDNQSFWGMGGKWSYEILKIDRSNLPIK